MFRLSVVSGPDSGRSFEVTAQRQLFVGRGAEASARLSDASVSRQHCRIEFVNNTIHVHDTGSASGTFVNGVPITNQIIYPGDVLVLGDTHLRVESGGAGRTVAPRGRAIPSLRDLTHLIGQKLVHYRLVESVACGERGQVFVATDERKGTKVAVKVLWPDLCAQPEERQRFERAMRTVYKVKHPNIVRVLQAASTTLPDESHLCWFASEFVDGPSLRELVGRVGTAGMLDWQIAWHITNHIAAALECAHENGILHRNITPDNVLMSVGDNTSKLGDLMLAKATSHLTTSDITRPGQLVGDIAYMSPERLAGQTIDVRSDIYSLGATIYCALTGQAPFDDFSTANLITRIQNDEPMPPTIYHLAIDGKFEGIVMKMLEKRPERRFQTPTELVNELQRVGRYAGIA